MTTFSQRQSATSLQTIIATDVMNLAVFECAPDSKSLKACWSVIRVVEARLSGIYLISFLRSKQVC